MKKALLYTMVLLLVTGAFGLGWWLTKKTAITSGKVNLTNEVGGVKISLRDKNKLTSVLADAKVIDQTNVEKVQITIYPVEQFVQTDKPVYLQRDTEGNLIIAAEQEMENKTLTVNLFVSEFVINHERAAEWMEGKLGQALSHIARVNNHSAREGELALSGVFMVEKK